VILLIVVYYLLFIPKTSPLKTNHIKECNERINGLIDKGYSPFADFTPPGYNAPNAKDYLYGNHPFCVPIHDKAIGGNSKICSKLEDEQVKAACVGSSVFNLEDYSICEQFIGESKDICLMNVLNKLSMQTVPTEDMKLICDVLNAEDFKVICNGVIFQTYYVAFNESISGKYWTYENFLY
jgi:hypothetical protein